MPCQNHVLSFNMIYKKGVQISPVIYNFCRTVIKSRFNFAVFIGATMGTKKDGSITPVFNYITNLRERRTSSECD